MALPPSFEARLVHARALTPSVRELVLERTDGAPIVFEAGQWVSLVLPHAGGELRRAYSIASEPNGTPRFDLAVTRVEDGPGSQLLHTLEPGATLTAIGPQGFFTRPPDRRGPSLLVATGTGMTPFRSMMRAAVASRETAPLWLLFGVRREEDLLYRDELEALAASHPNVRVETTLSRPDETWSGRRGYVQAHVKELLDDLGVRGALAGADARPAHVYVCGLHRMVGAVRELLRKELNLPRERVHTERYD